jgi:selenide,water dikinase
MARGAGIGAEIWFDRVPVLPGARETIAKGITPGGTRRNLEHYTPEITWDGPFSDADKKLLADPQTSGGLLFAVAPDRCNALVEALEQEAALAHAVVGRFVEGAGLRITPSP